MQVQDILARAEVERRRRWIPDVVWQIPKPLGEPFGTGLGVHIGVCRRGLGHQDQCNQSCASQLRGDRRVSRLEDLCEMVTELQLRDEDFPQADLLIQLPQ